MSSELAVASYHLIFVNVKGISNPLRLLKHWFRASVTVFIVWSALIITITENMRTSL